MNPFTGAIVPSAGRGIRMNSGDVKQFRIVNRLPVLEHTLHRLLLLEKITNMVIPTISELKDRTRDIVTHCLKRSGNTGKVDIAVIDGGMDRMESVENGLKYLSESGVEVVMVHDAVRPCFPADSVFQALEMAISEGAAILAVPAKDTVKIVDDRQCVTSTPDRNRVWLAQTPQIFRKELMCDAYEIAHQAGFRATDDASLVEFAGYPVHVVEGSWDNIKITYPSDLFIAEKWLKSNA